MSPRFWRGWDPQQIRLGLLSLLQFLSICEGAISQPKVRRFWSSSLEYGSGIWVGRTSTSGLGVICLSSASRLRSTNFSSPFYSVRLFRSKLNTVLSIKLWIFWRTLTKLLLSSSENGSTLSRISQNHDLQWHRKTTISINTSSGDLFIAFISHDDFAAEHTIVHCAVHQMGQQGW